MTNQVNIKILGVEDALILNAMQVLNQTFFTSSTINESEQPDLIFYYEEKKEGDELIVTGTLNQDVQTIRRQLEANESKTRKYAYLAVYLLLLQHHTGHIQAWG